MSCMKHSLFRSLRCRGAAGSLRGRQLGFSREACLSNRGGSLAPCGGWGLCLVLLHIAAGTVETQNCLECYARCFSSL